MNIDDLKVSLSQKGDFYTGVIEDNKDPEKMGRVRVRVMGVHTEDKKELPTDALPWSTVLAPANQGQITGIGVSSVPLQGTWVLVIFSGNDFQNPIILGTLNGLPTKTQFDTTKGFRDPDKQYPIKDRVKEPDMNRLARGEDYSKTELSKKRDANLESGVSYTTDGSSNSGNFSMPRPLNSKSKYPDNTVIETKSGHIIEIDDTEGNERIHIFHTSGSFHEFRPDGSVTSKATASRYDVVNGNSYSLVNGKRVMVTDGDMGTTVGGDMNTTVGGQMNIGVGDRVSIKTGNIMNLSGGLIFIN